MSKKIVVYTSIINPEKPFGIHENYDRLKDPGVIEKGVDYICYTNNPKLKSNVYNIIQVPLKFGDASRSSREMKILPHKYLSEYDISIYIDGSHGIRKGIRDFAIKKMKIADFVARKHDKRSCVYDEAKHLINIFDTNPKDNPEIIREHIKRYEKQKYPQNNGLISTGVIIRKHNDTEIIKCMEEWWSTYMNGSRRDQLSLPYALWKMDYKVQDFIAQSEQDELFFQIGHRIKRGCLRNT